jgi:hypothetical protein
MFVPPSGTHYTVEYGDIKASVDDYTDREGVQFEYINGDTSIVLKKKEVDSSTPAAALSQTQAENQSRLLDLATKVLDR